MIDPLAEIGSLMAVDFDAGALFSGQPSGRKIKGYAAPCRHTPAIDPDYLFPSVMRDLVVWFMSGSDPLYLFGPTGSGKTSLVRQVAARLHYPVFDVTGHGRLEFSDLAGHLTVDNGSMRFQHGPLALAMKHGGLFLLNEIDLLDPATAAGLNGVLDGAPLCIPENGGEVIPPLSPYPVSDLCALRVRGVSMDLVDPDGSYVICMPLRKVGSQPKTGERVVVERHRIGSVEANIKEVEILGDGKVLLWPRSSSLAHQEPVELTETNLFGYGLADGAVKFLCVDQEKHRPA